MIFYKLVCFYICETMTFSQGAAVRLLEFIGSHLWSFKPNMMRHFVLEYGSVKAVVWFARNMPKYERILQNWGPVRTHLISTTLSTLQGCAYCTYGHAYALQLQYYKQTDRLFPLDEQTLFELHKVAEKDVFKQLSTALAEAGLQSEIQWLEKLASLRSMSPRQQQTAATENPDINDLLHLLNMFAVLNYCGIKHQVVPDEAHDPINRDTALRARYAERRGAPKKLQQDNTSVAQAPE